MNRFVFYVEKSRNFSFEVTSESQNNVSKGLWYKDVQEHKKDCHWFFCRSKFSAQLFLWYLNFGKYSVNNFENGEENMILATWLRLGRICETGRLLPKSWKRKTNILLAFGTFGDLGRKTKFWNHIIFDSVSSSPKTAASYIHDFLVT